MASQCFCKDKILNSIGYSHSPKHAQVANIDPICSFYTGFQKSENKILIVLHLYLHGVSMRTDTKEIFFEKVKRLHFTKHHSQKKSQGICNVCQIVLDDHGLVVLLFFQVDLLLTCLKQLTSFQKYFPITAKVMPWSL